MLASLTGHTEIARLLVVGGMGASQASKADVEANDEDGWTPLHSASQNGHDKVAQLLVVREEGKGRGKCPYL